MFTVVVCRSSHPPNCLCYLITIFREKVAHKCTCFILTDEIRTLIIQSPQHPTRNSGCSVVKTGWFINTFEHWHTHCNSLLLATKVQQFRRVLCLIEMQIKQIFFSALLRDSLKGNPRANFEPFKYENDNRVGAPDCGAEVWDLSRPPIENGRR